ncbi:MAG TPA: oxidoreductase family protein [Chitinophagales bacterium]|nr:oxidoreductase family protein [Chitinophagales bacterium]
MGIPRTIRVFFIWLLYLIVAGGTYVIVWLDRRLKFKLPFPRDADELAQKQDWLVAQLRQKNALPDNAVITGYTVKPLNQAVIYRSNACVADIHYTTGNENKTLTCFAKFAPTVGTIWNRVIFNFQMNHVKEILFNANVVAERPGFPAPVVYFAQLSFFTGNLCLVTEFMSDCVEHDKETRREEFSQQQLDLVLEGLATLHGSFWNSTEPVMKNIMPIENSTVDFFESLVLFSWGRAARKILHQSWVYMNRPQTVLHGDARMGNMMFPAAPGRGRFVFLDWQAVRKGMAAYDLAYFIILSLMPERRQQDEVYCLDTYYNLLTEKGAPNYSRQQLEDDYKHACLCVLVLLSLPMLSGEASAEGEGARNFVYGMGIWRKLLQIKFEDFDYAWVAQHYNITEQEGRAAVAEMLGTIETRLNQITLKGKA